MPLARCIGGWAPRLATRSGPVSLVTEASLWAPPSREGVVEWAMKHIRIPAGARPGPYDPALSPYVNEILECCGDQDTTEIDIMKSVQSSGSTTTQIAMGYWMDTDPSDILVVYPGEPTARDQISRRVLPIFVESPRLNRLLAPAGTTKTQINLVTGRICSGWSGSPASLAANPYQRVICDEVDKYIGWRGVEADPINLARDRTLTYGSRAKVIVLSTPTTKSSAIWQAWTDASDRRRWWVKCPACSVWQRLAWERFNWPGHDQTEDTSKLVEGDYRRQVADQLDRGEIECWWACVSCDHRVYSKQARGLVSAGKWVSDVFGLANSDKKTPRRAYHIWAAMSPFVSWNHLVAEYLRARATGGGTWQNFVNNYLGEPYEQTQGGVSIEVFSDKGKGKKPAVCPTWTARVVATADPQHNRIWWMVRAWGNDYRSRLLGFGQVDSYEELNRVAIRDWPVAETGKVLRTAILIIDAGGSNAVDGQLIPRSDETLRYAATNRSLIIPILGRNRQNAGDPRIRISDSEKASAYGVTVRLIDTNFYKDVLAYRLNTPSDREPAELWEENESITQEYAKHMTSEERVQNKRKEWVWQLKVKSSRNDWWDCAVYQCAAADLVEVADARPADRAEEPAGLYQQEESWWNGLETERW